MKDKVQLRAVGAHEMLELDRRAMQEYGIPGIILMENAGRCAADAAEQIWRSRGLSGTIGVYCGPGNNGGDGFVAARHLANRGYAVEVVLVKPPSALKSDALVNYTIIQHMRLPIIPFPCAPHCALIVDAVLGIGAAGMIAGVYRDAIESINSAGVPVLAVDIPSGLDTDTGQPLGTAVRADATITMSMPKRGFAVPGAARYTGTVAVADIGVPRVLLVENNGVE